METRASLGLGKVEVGACLCSLGDKAPYVHTIVLYPVCLITVSFKPAHVCKLHVLLERVHGVLCQPQERSVRVLIGCVTAFLDAESISLFMYVIIFVWCVVGSPYLPDTQGWVGVAEMYVLLLISPSSLFFREALLCCYVQVVCIQEVLFVLRCVNFSQRTVNYVDSRFSAACVWMETASSDPNHYTVWHQTTFYRCLFYVARGSVVCILNTTLSILLIYY